MLGKSPIFVVGCTNSGTTVLHDVLRSHPEVDGIGIEPHYGGLAPNIAGRLNRLFALWPAFTDTYVNENSELASAAGFIFPDQVHDWFKCWYEFHQQKGRGSDTSKRQLVKEPKFSLRVRWLKCIWPDCYIVAIVRNPWSVVEGIKRKLSQIGDLPLIVDTPTALAQWVNVNSCIMIDSKNISNFSLVRYEDMINADVFPNNGTDKNCFWMRLLSHLNLSADNFKIPNETPKSHFDNSRDAFSLSRLSKWDIDFITYTAAHLIKEFKYSSFLEEKCMTKDPISANTVSTAAS